MEFLEVSNCYFTSAKELREALVTFFAVTFPNMAEQLRSRLNDCFHILKSAFSFWLSISAVCVVNDWLLGSLQGSFALKTALCRGERIGADQPHWALQLHLATELCSTRSQNALFFKNRTYAANKLTCWNLTIFILFCKIKKPKESSTKDFACVSPKKHSKTTSSITMNTSHLN